MNVWDYLDYLEACIRGCSGDVRRCLPTVYGDDDEYGEFDAIAAG